MELLDEDGVEDNPQKCISMNNIFLQPIRISCSVSIRGKQLSVFVQGVNKSLVQHLIGKQSNDATPLKVIDQFSLVARSKNPPPPAITVVTIK